MAVVDTKIPDHSIWSTELDKYVSENGLVNYSAWKENQDKLNHYLQQLSGPLPLSNWSQNVQLAYWLNLYNAYTIKLVLEHYPMDSVTELFDGMPWSEPWIELGDSLYSLDQIQLEIRKQFNEPRTHFALNNATKSSPPLLREAYIPERLGEQLNAQAECFISNSSLNQFTDSTAILSPIFRLYKGEFKPDILTYLKKYLPDTQMDHLTIQFFELDMAINEQPAK